MRRLGIIVEDISFLFRDPYFFNLIQLRVVGYLNVNNFKEIKEEKSRLISWLNVFFFYRSESLIRTRRVCSSLQIK